MDENDGIQLERKLEHITVIEKTDASKIAELQKKVAVLEEKVKNAGKTNGKKS